MQKFKFYIDQTVISKDRFSFIIEADSLEEAKITALAIHNHEEELPDNHDVEGIGDTYNLNPNDLALPCATRTLNLYNSESEIYDVEIATNYTKSIQSNTNEIAYENSSVIIYCVSNYYKIVWKDGGNDVYQPTLSDAKKYLGITDYTKP